MNAPAQNLPEGVRIFPQVVQGSDEWAAMRCGMLTASEMKLLLTPTLKIANNDKERAHLFELLAQRITRYVEPRYISDDMLRGINDELEARMLYAKTYSAVQEVGFITNDKWGFTLGYSPDGLVGDVGQLECKSRSQRLQIRTLIEFANANTIDPDFMIQVQTGLLVSERKWCDVVSYCGGLPMVTVRVYPDDNVQNAILGAADDFEAKIAEKMAVYRAMQESRSLRMLATERKIIQEMI